MQSARLFLSGLFIILVVSCFLLWERSGPQNIGKVTISGAVAKALPNDAQSVVVSLKIKNEGPSQKILSVSSADADHGMIAGLERNAEAILPADSNLTLGRDGVHFVLMKVRGTLEEGRLLSVKLVLDPTGEVVTKARFSSKPAGGHGMHQMKHGDGTEKGKVMVGVFEVPANEPQPALTMKVMEDNNTDGWKVSVETQNFRFAKELADGEHVAGTGHGHIYINGAKLGRLYKNVAMIGALPKGKHVVRVTLNTNDHQTYMVAGKRVTATAEVIVD